MRIRARRRFEDDLKRIQARLKRSSPFSRAFYKAIRMLEQGQDLTAYFNGHRLINEGEGWFCCYIHEDIIMIYKVEGKYVKLSRLGTPGELEKKS